MSETVTKNLYQRMLAIMADVRYIQKSDKKVNNQYSFVTHDSVTKALHDPLVTHGVLVIPTVREMRQDGNRTVAVVDVTFVNVDSPDQTLQVTYTGYGIDTQDKGPGKAVSYAVKYALLKVFCLETGDDPERDTVEYNPGKIAQEHVLTLIEMIGEDAELKRKVLGFCNAERYEDITKDKYTVVINKLKAKVAS